MVRVLLVDDEQDIGLLLSGILRREGIETTIALSLSEAGERLHDQEYDVVFLDLNLPDGVGYTLIPSIRRRKETKIVVVSAYDGEKDKATREGADYFISKPFRKEDVIHALQELHLTN
jgi:CheY-like chemotaxis protein